MTFKSYCDASKQMTELKFSLRSFIGHFLIIRSMPFRTRVRCIENNKKNKSLGIYIFVRQIQQPLDSYLLILPLDILLSVLSFDIMISLICYSISKPLLMSKSWMFCVNLFCVYIEDLSAYSQQCQILWHATHSIVLDQKKDEKKGSCHDISVS